MKKIKANTAMCVAVKQISNEQWKHWATREGAVTPSRGKERMQQEFLTGYGYGPFYPRVVLFNHNDYDIIVREHEIVGEFHPMPPGMARVYESGDEMARDVSTVFQKDLRQNVGEGLVLSAPFGEATCEETVVSHDAIVPGEIIVSATVPVKAYEHGAVAEPGRESGGGATCVGGRTTETSGLAGSAGIEREAETSVKDAEDASKRTHTDQENDGGNPRETREGDIRKRCSRKSKRLH